MSVMGIAEAKAMAPADLEIGPEHVARARAEAVAAEKRAAELADAAIEGGKDAPAASEVVDAHATADLVRQRADRIRQRAATAKAARRLLDLEALGQDVEQLADAVSKPDTSIEALIQRIAGDVAELTTRCQDHDTAVLALVARARQLGAEKAGPLGPLATSAHVAVVGNGINGRTGIQSGSAAVLRIEKSHVGEAVEAAVTGNPTRAVRILAGAKTTAKPKQAAHYFMGTGGHVVTSDHPIPAAFAEQIRQGILRELSADEVEAHLNGRLHGHQG